MILNYDNADRKLAKLTASGRDIRWDNYTLVEFTPNDSARFNKNGVWRNGQYGFQRKYEVNDKGLWYIPVKKN